MELDDFLTLVFEYMAEQGKLDDLFEKYEYEAEDEDE